MHQFFSSVVAMGSPRGGTIGGGSILTFKYNDISSKWDQYGNVIQGLAGGDATGYSLSLSDTGSTMVVGSPRVVNLDGARNAGKITMYAMDEWEWQVVGQTVYGEAEGDMDGTSVALSPDGSVVVVGGKGHSQINAATSELMLKSNGHCRVYIFQGGEWKLEHTLEGASSEEQLGSSVAVSSDNNIIACGGSYGGINKSGVVRLWNRETLEESTIWPQGTEADAKGSLFGSSIALSMDGECVTIGAPAWGFVNGGPSTSGAIQIFRDAYNRSSSPIT